MWRWAPQSARIGREEGIADLRSPPAERL